MFTGILQFRRLDPVLSGRLSFVEAGGGHVGGVAVAWMPKKEKAGLSGSGESQVATELLPRDAGVVMTMSVALAAIAAAVVPIALQLV